MGLFSVLFWVIVLNFVSHASPIAASSQCWIGQIRLIQGSANGIYPLGPYPDRDAILAAAKLKLDELLLGQPYNESCYPINPPLPIISTYMTCSWIGCDVESCNPRTGICTPWISDRHVGASNGVASCSLGYLHTYNDKLQANPSPACAGSYTVRLSPSNNAPESSTILVTVEPDKLTESIVAKVYDNNGQVVPNAKVKLELNVDVDSGGHHQHGSERPKGSLRSGTMTGETITGSTSTNGFVFTFKAPAPAGDHKITASCTDGKNCKQEGPDTVWVGFKDLIELPGLDVYVRIPNMNDPKHPDNHYMTYTAMLRVTALATLYHGQFPDDPLLHLNDASLERGGLFDYKAKDGAAWEPPHETHREGIHIDIRANPNINPDTAIPLKNFKDFVEISKKAGGIARLHNVGTSTSPRN